MSEAVQTRHHGSQTLEEMAQRLSKTGLEPWQVTEEINEFERSLAETDANTERIIVECAQSHADTTPQIVEETFENGMRTVSVQYFHHPFTFVMPESAAFTIETVDFAKLIGEVRSTMNGRGGYSGVEIELDDDGETVKRATIKMEDTTVPFERIRRITGYLVGTLDRFNDAKRAEESQRVKHSVAAK